MRTTSLLAQLNRLLLYVGLGAALAGGTIAWVAWEGVLDAHAERIADEAQAHYRQKLAEAREERLRAARRLRADLEFLRLGALPPRQRHTRLTAFFTNQGEYQYFNGLLLVGPDGLPFFALGCQALLQEGLDRTQSAIDGLPELLLQGLCQDASQVYAITHTPLWLGAEGHGTAVYATALDHGWLKRLARRMDTVYLVADGRIVASSRGEEGLQHALDLTPPRPRPGGHLQVTLPLSLDGDAEGPLLVVRRPFEPLLATPELLFILSALVLLLLTLVWLGLGPRLLGIARRIDDLAAGALGFMNHFRRDAQWSRRLAQATAKQDEVGLLAQALDRLMAESELRQQEQAAYQQTLELLEEVVLELDAAGRLQRVSRAWRALAGGTEDGVGRPLPELLHPEDATVLRELITSLAQGQKDQATARVRMQPSGGPERWLELRLARSPPGDCLRGVARDITQHYLQERRITHMALHDALTDLPNRMLLEDRLKMAMRLAQRSEHKVALGFVDLDHFKHVNDSLGHKTGDALLVAFAQRLRTTLRSGDTLARWGGDEFVLLLPDMPNLVAIREVADKLRAVAEVPLRVEETEFNVTFSAGIAVFPDDSEDADVLLAHADRAMFHGKAQGRNTVQLYCDMMHKDAGRKDIYI